MAEDLEKRIDMLIAHSKGTMPVGILAADRAEAEVIPAILARKRRGKILTVMVETDGYTVEYKPEKEVAASPHRQQLRGHVASGASRSEGENTRPNGKSA